MRLKYFGSLTVVAALGMAPAAWADHMSPWGEGWANMTNDTHDTRIDTLDDNDAFLDYVGDVSGGGASESGSDTASGGGQGNGGPRV